LDDGHWDTHILRGHPELAGYQDRVIEALRQPDDVYRSKRDPTTRIYVRSYGGIVIENTPIEKINLRVVVREKDGFVVTAYFAVATWRGLGERIWPL